MVDGRVHRLINQPVAKWCFVFMVCTFRLSQVIAINNQTIPQAIAEDAANNTIVGTVATTGSPKLAMEQLVLFLKESQAGNSLSRDDIKQLLNLCVDIIVQLQNVNGKRFVSEVYLCQTE